MENEAAKVIAQRIIRELQPLCERIELVGSLRRGKPEVKDIDILVAGCKEGFKEEMQKRSGGNVRWHFIVEEGIAVDVAIADENAWGAGLMHWTGSKEENIRLRRIAMGKGLKLNQYGLFDLATNKRLAGKTEEEVYHMLCQEYKRPEDRDGHIS